MEVENWRTRELNDEALSEVKKLLFSLPRTQWKLARLLPPLSLVKINAPGYPETFATIVDYGSDPKFGEYVVSALLDQDGQLMLNPDGRVQVAAASQLSVSLVSTCGQIDSKWMNRHLCDG